MSSPSRREFIAGALAFPALAGERSYAEQFPDMLLTHLAGKLNALAENHVSSAGPV